MRDRIGDADGGRPRKVSLRASDDRVDVSRIARAQGGGGHRQAAGFSTALSRRARRVPAEQLRAGTSPRRRSSPRSSTCLTPPVRRLSCCYDKPAGITSHDVVAASGARSAARIKVGHAGTLDPFATGLLLVLVGRATRVQRFLMALPKTYEATARFGAVSTTGDPEGEIVATGRGPRRRSGAADRA